MLKRLHPLCMVPLAGAILGVNLFLFPSLHRRFAPGGSVRPLDLHLVYTPTTVREVLEALGPRGRAGMIWIATTVDLVYPLIYGLFLALALLHLFPPRSRVVWVPAVAVGADLVENALLAVLAGMYPAFPSALAWAVALATLTKWGAVGFSLALVGWGGIRRLRHPLAGNAPPSTVHKHPPFRRGRRR